MYVSKTQCSLTIALQTIETKQSNQSRETLPSRQILTDHFPGWVLYFKAAILWSTYKTLLKSVRKRNCTALSSTYKLDLTPLSNCFHVSMCGSMYFPNIDSQMARWQVDGQVGRQIDRQIFQSYPVCSPYHAVLTHFHQEVSSIFLLLNITCR